ncbi:hypothetical protein RHGRI_027635 [Rhododendron griersonianum]|uniref:Uncharacterized protein n=1 Tax=Rhododendron griersonianum TaxID=479676 RepID=A0AAV6IXH5_9ERIC|nr:hypothetical protein RHGRI_027635 [Rhododendron griersonianum]
MFRFLENKCQLAIKARTPVEEIHIDGLTQRTVKYNFTPIAALHQVKNRDTKLVGPRRYINDSYVVNVRVIDHSFQPSIVSLWDKFTEYEAPAMANLPGNFPVVIGLRLKTSTYYGLTLATRNSSSFIFDPPPLPEVTALQSWCTANAAKIRELPIAPAAHLAMPTADEDSEDDITKIANLPMSVEKVLHALKFPIMLYQLDQGNSSPSVLPFRSLGLKK